MGIFFCYFRSQEKNPLNPNKHIEFHQKKRTKLNRTIKNIIVKFERILCFYCMRMYPKDHHNDSHNNSSKVVSLFEIFIQFNDFHNNDKID